MGELILNKCSMNKGFIMAKTKKMGTTTVNKTTSQWGWLLLLGILNIILGTIGLGMVVGLTVVSMYFFGALLIIAGIGHAVDFWKYSNWPTALWQFFIAILYILAGVMFFYDPFLASTIITLIIAAILIVIGLTRIIMVIVLKDYKGWLWLILAGLTAVILGLLIIMQWPLSGLWIIGLFIAIELIVTGWTYVCIAFVSRV